MKLIDFLTLLNLADNSVPSPQTSLLEGRAYLRDLPSLLPTACRQADNKACQKETTPLYPSLFSDRQKYGGHLQRTPHCQDTFPQHTHYNHPAVLPRFLPAEDCSVCLGAEYIQNGLSGKQSYHDSGVPLYQSPLQTAICTSPLRKASVR